MQKLKTAIKKMAAIGAGVAMLGATMTSAVAMDLSEYPSPFVDANGVFDESTAIVVGADAAASDTLGAVDIATNLQFMAKTPVSSSDGTVTVTGGVTEDVPIGLGIANSSTVALEWQMDDGDISSFQDTVVSFQGADYDVHDELIFSKTSPSVETSLTASDDDYESGVFMHVNKDSIKYYYAFDSTINVSTATSSEPLEIKFLGKTLKITEIYDVGNKFTAYVGGEYFLDVGDVVTADGKKVTLQNVGSGGAIVIDVDGTIETISASTTETVNGIEVTNDETFYADSKDERSASLVIGEDAQATYKDGDEYVGEDSSDPDWVWDIGSLDDSVEASTAITSTPPTAPTGPYIGIENDYVKDDDGDNPAGIGECYDLPNEYASICFDSLTIPDEDYLTTTIEYAANEDTSESGANWGGTSAPTIHIYAPGDERFIIPKNAFSKCFENGTLNNNDQKTSEVWIQGRNETAISVFYKDSSHNPSTRHIGDLCNATNFVPSGANGFLQLNYESTKDSNIWFNISNISENMFNVVLDVNGDSTSELPDNHDNIVMNFSTSGTATDIKNFSKLGATESKEESGELNWYAVDQTTKYTGIGTKDEDHRTRYGIIIKDPKSNGGSDKVVVEIPSDDVQANIVVKGQATTVSGGSTSYIPADITIDTKLDTEIASAANHELILVGGPVVNTLTAQFIGSEWTLDSGEALIKMVNNGENVALVVAGTDAIDTRMACKVLANYEDYSLETTEAVVTGTLSAPQIKVA